MAVRLLFRISVLLVLTQMLYRAVTQQCTNGGYEVSIFGWMLQKHIYDTMFAERPDACLIACRKDDRCQSFNFVISLHMCEFSNRTKEARPEDFIPNPDRFYFRRDIKRVPLGSIPELPAETCKEIKASEGGQAVSKKYWMSNIKPGVPVLAYCDMKTEDVNECSVSPSFCDVNANCQNNKGSYLCSCKVGFTGDGKTCKDINECSVSPSICDVDAKCQNNEGSYLCSCKVGFTGDGKTCKDINECSVSPSICDVNANCQNNEGSYLCSCNVGFTGDGKTCVPFVTVTSSCGNLLVRVANTSGLISSQAFDSFNYQNNMDCSWSLSSNAMLEIAFASFNTHSSADYLVVYDGDSPSSPLIGRFSGSSLPAPIASSSNKLYLRFISDSSGQDFGFRASYQAITPGSIRLQGGKPSAGRVEIFYDDQWGTICDDAWDMNDAKVVCRHLGGLKPSQAFRGAHHGQGSGPIWMDDVACSGSESHIYNCRHRGWGNNDCTHSRDAGVQCTPIRLVNGGVNYGRVEVFYKGIWGTVCDDDWDINDAHVVCRQLGFPSASSAPQSATYGQGSDPIWMDDINCQGGEASLFDCPRAHSPWGVVSCVHSEDASVVCNT